MFLPGSRGSTWTTIEARSPLLWLSVPLLAFLAYSTVTEIGFLSDDFLLLYTARERGFDLNTWLPDPGWYFYRPIGTFLTWQVGWQLWGFDPLPYHLAGLLVHAASSLLLGLWLAEVTSERALGWLAGALFAVFPLHSEAVGWLAAQWDALTTLFALLSLWLFTIWGRIGGGVLYAISLLSFTLGVFTKESILTFLPLLGFSSWLVDPSHEKVARRRLFLALLPFCVPVVINLALRFATWGTLTGYRTTGGGYAERYWDGLLDRAHMLLSPINSSLLGSVTSQVVGMVSSLGLLFGIILYGTRNRRILAVAAAWILLALLPTLDFPVQTMDLQNNRYLYLASAGYCAVVAVLLYAAISGVKRRLVSLIVVGAILLMGVAASWLQLRPWQTASVQATELERDLLELIPAPAQPRPQPMLWFAQDTPDNYKGAYIFRLGLGGVRDFTGGDGPWVENVGDASQVDLASPGRDAFALRFSYDEQESRFQVAYGAGITDDGELPASARQGRGGYVWDFRTCAAETLGSWQMVNAQARCVQSEGLMLRPTNPDPQIVLPDLDVPLSADDAKYVRLRVSVSYPSDVSGTAVTSQWFWRISGNDWSADRTRLLPIRRDGKPHTYWAFLQAYEAGDISALRFDPANGQVEATVRWIAVDQVAKK